MTSVLITGGARSGKSAIAVELARRAAEPVTFVATAEPIDDDMAERIAHHRNERPSDWTTIEAPLDPSGAMADVDRSGVVVLDCLTLWVGNHVVAGDGRDLIDAADRLSQRLLEFSTAIVVTNEVGSGIVPDNEMARSYRDVLGRVNATFARRFETVLLAVAGRALEVSPV